MARSIWSGFLSFGLVSVPVALYPATTDQDIHFHQLHAGTSHRIRYRKVDEVSGDEVAQSDIVSGYPLGDGEYVVVGRDELREIAPGKSEAIEVTDFINLAEIDPVFFRQTYVLAPRGKGADRAYALLRQAMAETGKVAVATLVLREKEHLVAVRPVDDALLLETMYFADEVRAPADVLDEIPRTTASEREVAMAMQFVDALSAPWEPERYENTYRRRVEELIETKRAGHVIVVDDSDRPRANVIDLMAALEASVARSASRRAGQPRSEAAEAEVRRPVPTTRTRRQHPGEQQSFSGMSKAELLERAAAVDLQGRSKMTKPELVKALQSTTAKRRRAS